MTDKPLVERLRGAYSTVFERSLALEAAALIEQLTADRDRHERDVDVFRQRWIEKCAEVERLTKLPPYFADNRCLMCGDYHGAGLPCPNMAPRSAV